MVTRRLKHLLLILVVALCFAMCTETEFIEVEKYIHKTDTVRLTEFVDRYFAGTDTVIITQIVEIPTPVRGDVDSVIIIETRYDTVYLQRIDTVWRTQVVVERDTVVIREYSYGDTLVIWGGRDTYSVPAEVMPILSEFYQEAGLHGYEANGGEVIIEIVPMDDVLQAQSFEFNTQVVIRINDNLTNSERFVPLFRELSRLQLGKEYSQDPESLLYPFHPANLIRWDNRNQHKERLKEFFL